MNRVQQHASTSTMMITIAIIVMMVMMMIDTIHSSFYRSSFVFVNPQSTSDNTAPAITLTTISSTIESDFFSSSSSSAASLATIGQTIPLRCACITVAAAFVSQCAIAYGAQIATTATAASGAAFSVNFYFAGTIALVKAEYLNNPVYDFAIITASPTAADYMKMPALDYFPLQANGVVPAYNLPSSVTNGAVLALPGLVLCRIYRANITSWLDPAITSSNPTMLFSSIPSASTPLIVMLLTTPSAIHLVFSSYCLKIDPGFALAGITTSTSFPPYPTAKYAQWQAYANMDMMNSAVSDYPYSIAMTTLSNARVINLAIGSIINSVGTPIVANKQSISLNLFDLGTSGYPAGSNAFDLTNPSTLAAWPIVTMTYLYIDSANALTTCASKRRLMAFLIWYYTSPVVISLASALSLVALPEVFIAQLGVLARLNTEVTCLGSVLIPSNQQTGFLAVNSHADAIMTMFAQFYYTVDAARTYTVSTATKSLALDRLVAGELDFTLINANGLTAADATMINSVSVATIPAFLVGVTPIFNLPSLIQTLYAQPLLALSMGLPSLYPLRLTLNVMTSIFIGGVTSWTDPIIVALNPQLTSWFIATGASTTLTVIVGASNPSDPNRATKLMFQSMSMSATAQLPANKWAFASTVLSTNGLTTTTTSIDTFDIVVSTYPSYVQMIDYESRLTMRSSMVNGSISYRMIGTGASTTSTTGLTDITTEFSMIIVNANGITETVQPTTSALRQCNKPYLSFGSSSTALMTSSSASASLDNVDASAIASSIATLSLLSSNQRWVNPVVPAAGCWPLSTLISFIVPLQFTSSTTSSASSSSATSSSSSIPTPTMTESSCTSGIHALEFLNYIQTVSILTAPSESFGYVRMAESTLISRMSQQIIYSATCDGAPLLVISPFNYVIPTAFTQFGVVIAVIGIASLIITAVIVIDNHQQVVIRSASAPFLVLILIGLGFLLLSVICWSLPPTTLPCASFSWLLTIGFSGVFLPLFLKTWRVYRIFSGVNLRVVKLPNMKLFIMAAIGIGVDIVLMAIWQGVSPMRPIQYTKMIDGSRHYYTHCSVTASGVPFVAIQGVYKVGMLLFGAIMAFSTRNVKGTFNEASQIAWSIYNTLLSSLIVVAIIVFISAIETTLIVLVQIGLIWMIIASFGLVFGPKLYLLTQSEEKTIEAGRSSLPQEVTGGFSFASVASMTILQMKPYYAALKTQVNKIEQKLGLALTKFTSSTIRGIDDSSINESDITASEVGNNAVGGGMSMIGAQQSVKRPSIGSTTSGNVAGSGLHTNRDRKKVMNSVAADSSSASASPDDAADVRARAASPTVVANQRGFSPLPPSYTTPIAIIGGAALHHRPIAVTAIRKQQSASSSKNSSREGTPNQQQGNYRLLGPSPSPSPLPSPSASPQLIINERDAVRVRLMSGAQQQQQIHMADYNENDSNVATTLSAYIDNATSSSPVDDAEYDLTSPSPLLSLSPASAEAARRERDSIVRKLTVSVTAAPSGAGGKDSTPAQSTAAGGWTPSMRDALAIETPSDVEVFIPIQSPAAGNDDVISPPSSIVVVSVNTVPASSTNDASASSSSLSVSVGDVTNDATHKRQLSTSVKPSSRVPKK